MVAVATKLHGIQGLQRHKNVEASIYLHVCVRFAVVVAFLFSAFYPKRGKVKAGGLVQCIDHEQSPCSIAKATPCTACFHPLEKPRMIHNDSCISFHI